MIKEILYFIMITVFVYVYFQFIEPQIIVKIFGEQLIIVFQTVESQNEYKEKIEFVKWIGRTTILLIWFGYVVWIIRRATRKEPNPQLMR